MGSSQAFVIFQNVLVKKGTEKMKTTARVGLGLGSALLLGAVCGSAHAVSLTGVDDGLDLLDGNGALDIVREDGTNFEWIKLSETIGQSVNTALTPTRAAAGFRVATVTDMNRLYRALIMDSSASDIFDGSAGEQAILDTLTPEQASTFISLFGQADTNKPEQYTYGAFYDGSAYDGVYVGVDFYPEVFGYNSIFMSAAAGFFNQSDSFSFRDAGIFLVREGTPAVPTPALFPSLLGMGLATFRKRKLAQSEAA